jgi:hypothetical protein
MEMRGFEDFLRLQVYEVGQGSLLRRPTFHAGPLESQSLLTVRPQVLVPEEDLAKSTTIDQTRRVSADLCFDLANSPGPNLATNASSLST